MYEIRMNFSTAYVAKSFILNGLAKTFCAFFQDYTMIRTNGAVGVTVSYSGSSPETHKHTSRKKLPTN